jgi:hypothetical protein
MRWIVAGFALIGGTAAAQTAVAPPITAAEQVAIDQAERRGQLIYAYDRAAWLASDDLKAKMPDSLTKAGGWIVDGPATTPELVFIDRAQPVPHAIYVADFKDGKLTSSHPVSGGDAVLSPARLALAAALHEASAAAQLAGVQPCGAATFNSVVLPPERAGDPTLVYLLTPQTNRDAFPIGGHFLVEISADGSAGPVQPFARSCLDVQSRQGGHEAVLMAVSDLLHPTPTELHVFMSFAAQKPLAVMALTSNRLWVVAGPRVRALAPLPGAKHGS